MLDPQDRLALTEALAPPAGFTLAHGVGTTFTLDLETALTVPLALAAKRVESSDDALSILDALRRTEQQVDIFAQAGQISMGQHSSLVALLERSVHQVAQRRGLFHPKVWFLRFESDDGETRFRFICSSRNLTQDRSWDVVVQLDGAPGDVSDERVREQNLPMADLLRRLPDLMIHSLEGTRHARLNELADQWEQILWELPDGARELRFHAYGPGANSTIDTSGTRSLIVSPFLSDDGLRLLRKDCRRETHVISRPESFERLRPESLGGLSSYIFDDAANLEDADSAVSEWQRKPLVGLHAKVIVHDLPRKQSRVLLGSANATGAAFRDNTEVMVELVGPVKQFGVKSTLEALDQLKEEYAPTGGETSTEQEEAEHRLEQMLRAIAASPVHMRLRGEGPCDVSVWSDNESADSPGVTIEWQMLRAANVVAGVIPAREEDAHTFAEVPLEQVTPFILVTAKNGSVTRRTILLARLLGDFERRRTAVLSEHITDRASFLRLLTMMLELAGFGTAAEAAIGDGVFGRFAAASGESAGLMEALAKALGYGTDAIADVERIIEYIASDDQQAAEILPEGFDELWSAVRDAYAMTKRGGA
ncbi:phospholipase D family protein [Agrococcus casei]|uniref:phospholipase D family protein n=1 Tax=Agrococcus casei TaxID=343512 RepID=UPI000B35835F|nr:hypothetical protein [Agrococcus casei]